MDNERRANATGRTTVVLVDDSSAIRQALARVIARSDELELVGEAVDYPSAFELLGRVSPHVAVIDRSMPGDDPTLAIEQLRARFPATALVLLTGTPVGQVEPRLLELVEICLDKCLPLPEAVASLEAVARRRHPTVPT